MKAYSEGIGALRPIRRSEPVPWGIFKGVKVDSEETRAVATGPASASSRRASLEDLYVRHRARAEALAYLLTGDPQLAQDLAQEAFVRLAGRFRHLRNPDSFEGYLRRTVTNLSRGHFRRLRVERSHAGLGEERMSAEPPDVEGGLELMAALRRLPHRQRAAVVLRFYEDLSEAQVAEVMRCSRRAVNSLVSRALDTLRRDVRREGG